MHKKVLPTTEWDTSREIRSVSLRFVALAALMVNLVLGGSQADLWIQLGMTSAYFLASVLSVFAVLHLPPRDSRTAVFVCLDAMLVIVVLHEHILGAQVVENHNVTTSALVVAFILLHQVGTTMNRRLVMLFSGAVIGAWTLMIGIMALRHDQASPGTFAATFFDLDLGLVASFGFAAFAVYLFANDNDRTRKEAMKIDQRRHNLSRFFSPLVVSELQEASAALDLKRRNAAIMFVDIRDFTSYAETASAAELATVLAEYRRIVAGAVFSHGGTIDKFIGDGVMAVFGQPNAQPDDADRALACALDLTVTLEDWRQRSRSGGPFLSAGIGLHYGKVIGGVLESGFHDEFTVIGDAVNVAQRLEVLAKTLDALLVVSSELLSHVSRGIPSARWACKDAVTLYGRRIPIDIAYVRRETTLEPDATVPMQDVETAQTALRGTPFQSPELEEFRSAPTG